MPIFASPFDHFTKPFARPLAQIEFFPIPAFYYFLIVATLRDAKSDLAYSLALL